MILSLNDYAGGYRSLVISKTMSREPKIVMIVVVYPITDTRNFEEKNYRIFWMK